MEDDQKYLRAFELASKIEEELKSLKRWSDHSLPEEKFENMGAFGANTLSFEQWIQFVLLSRLRDIIETKDSFPQGSMIATYALRAFDGDYETEKLHRLLYELDALVNGEEVLPEAEDQIIADIEQEKITLNSKEIPDVLFTVIDLLPQFEGDDLESQLQTIDSLLNVLHPSVRQTISSRIRTIASEKVIGPKVKQRIEQATDAIARGENAAEPYNHDEAMKKYREEHRRNFPNS